MPIPEVFSFFQSKESKLNQEKELRLNQADFFLVKPTGYSFADLQNKGYKVFYQGDKVRALKDEPGFQGQTYLYTGIFQSSLGRPVGEQLEIMQKEEIRLQGKYPGLSLTLFEQGATVIEAVLEASGRMKTKYGRYDGANILNGAYSRFGPNGSLIVGNFNSFQSRSSMSVSDQWSLSGSDIGLLLQARFSP